MACCMYLPAEILSMIVDNVQDQKTHHSLFLASRALNEMAGPRLYSQFKVAQNPDDADNDLLHSRLRVLLLTLSKYPERGAFIKYINTGTWMMHTSGNHRIKDGRLLDFLYSIVDELNPYIVLGENLLRQRARRAIAKGDAGALMIYLFSLCPNLEEVDTVLFSGPYHHSLPCLISHEKVLPSLQTVNLRYKQQEGGITWIELLTFLKMPTVVSITSQVEQCGHTAFPVSLIGSSAVRNLSFTNSCMDNTSLNEALRISRALKSFSYEHTRSYDRMTDFQPEQLGISLASFGRNTLESLRVLITSPIHLQIVRRLPLLDSLERLIDLEVSLPLLAPYVGAFRWGGPSTIGALPMSLERLILRDCDDETEIWACLDLVGMIIRGVALPKLRSITLGYRMAYDPREPESGTWEFCLPRPPRLDVLRDACNDIKVQLVIDRPSH